MFLYFAWSQEIEEFNGHGFLEDRIQSNRGSN